MESPPSQGDFELVSLSGSTTPTPQRSESVSLANLSDHLHSVISSRPVSRASNYAASNLLASNRSSYCSSPVPSETQFRTQIIGIIRAGTFLRIHIPHAESTPCIHQTIRVNTDTECHIPSNSSVVLHNHSLWHVVHDDSVITEDESSGNYPINLPTHTNITISGLPCVTSIPVTIEDDFYLTLPTGTILKEIVKSDADMTPPITVRLENSTVVVVQRNNNVNEETEDVAINRPALLSDLVPTPEIESNIDLYGTMIRSWYNVCKNAIYGGNDQTVPAVTSNQLITQPTESFLYGVLKNVTSGLIVVGATIGLGAIFKNRLPIMSVNIVNEKLAVEVINRVRTTQY